MTDRDKPTPEREAAQAWHDKLTATRRAEVEAEIVAALELDMSGPPHTRFLLVALDAERTAHRETRAAEKRQRNTVNMLHAQVCEVEEERDEARRDAVHVRETLDQLCDKDVCDRIDGYREALDD